MMSKLIAGLLMTIMLINPVRIVAQAGTEHYDAAWNSNDDLIAITNGHYIRLYTPQFVLIEELALPDTGPELYAVELEWSPNGDMLALYRLSSTMSKLEIWQPESFTLVQSWDEEELLGRITWKSDNTQLAAVARFGLYNWFIRFYDVQTGQVITELDPPNRSSIPGFAWSGDGEQVAMGTIEKTFLWDMTTTPPVMASSTIPDPSSDYNLQYSPSDHLVALTGATDIASLSQVQIWNTDTQQLAHVIELPEEAAVDAVRWGPQYLLIVGYDETVRLWDPDTWQETLIIPVAVNRYAPNPEWNGDGSAFLIQGEVLGFHIRDVETGAVLAILAQTQVQPTVTIEQTAQQPDPY
jgi:WD40 repeat protein